MPVNQYADEMKEDRKEQRRLAADDFFMSLPGDALSWEEQRLRDCIFNFLATSTVEQPHISKAGSDKEVQAARLALLPKGVGLKEWVERRIGGEIELDIDTRDGNPGMMVVTQAGRPALMDAKRRTGGIRAAAAPDKNEPKGKGKGSEPGKGKEDNGRTGKGKTDGKGNPIGRNPEPPPLSADDEMAKQEKKELKEAEKEEFFAALPADELTPAEQDMRSGLLDWLESRPNI